jgi:hypothetical protein
LAFGNEDTLMDPFRAKVSLFTLSTWTYPAMKSWRTLNESIWRLPVAICSLFLLTSLNGHKDFDIETLSFRIMVLGVILVMNTCWIHYLQCLTHCRRSLI